MKLRGLNDSFSQIRIFPRTHLKTHKKETAASRRITRCFQKNFEIRKFYTFSELYLKSINHFGLSQSEPKNPVTQQVTLKRVTFGVTITVTVRLYP